jgi:hypothetical protein
MTKAAELAKMGEVLTNSSKGRTNLIINGDMAINQRGATSGITSGYFVDRFTLSGCSASAVITSNTPTEFPTAITVSATSGNPIVTQKIESKNVQHLSGKVVTASFFAKNVSNATTLFVSLQYAGSADNWGSSTTITEHNLGSLSSDWVKYTASWTVPSGGLNGLQLNILCAGSSTFTMGVTGVMLQEGSVSTPFEHRSFGEELALCQRYYHRHVSDGSSQNMFGVGFCDSSTNATVQIHFPTTMRDQPSALETTGTAGNYAIREGGGADITCNAVPTMSGDTTPNVAVLGFTTSGSLTADSGCMGRAVSSGVHLSFTAEL